MCSMFFAYIVSDNIFAWEELSQFRKLDTLYIHGLPTIKGKEELRTRRPRFPGGGVSRDGCGAAARLAESRIGEPSLGVAPGPGQGLKGRCGGMSPLPLGGKEATERKEQLVKDLATLEERGRGNQNLLHVGAVVKCVTTEGREAVSLSRRPRSALPH